MTKTPIFKRVLFKVSGEGLSGEKQSTGLSGEALFRIAREIKSVYEMGVDVCLVVGGGNFFRGALQSQFEGEPLSREQADYIGMTATLLNGMALKSVFEKLGLKSHLFSALELKGHCPLFSKEKALKALDEKQVVIFTGGIGKPFFTTDTASATRAIEMKCDAVFKTTQVDGIYTKDPLKYKDAVFLETLSYETALKNHLKIMDEEAILLLKKSSIPLCVFNQHQKGLFPKVICGEGKFTLMNEKGEKRV